jgi:UTP--glucose-1-phosphate uridylyltransferase
MPSVSPVVTSNSKRGTCYDPPPIMSIDIAVVPVAGLGTRLLPATKSQPKEMLPVGRKPVVQYVCEELTGAGLRRILFITGPGKTSLENHFDINEELVQLLRESGKEELLTSLEFERAEVQYFYTRQRKALGLGHAVLAARAFVGHEPFVVALGDSIIGLNRQSDIVRRMRQVFDDKEAAAVIALEEVPREEVRHYGIAQPRQTVDGLVELADLVEKPNPADAPSTLAIAARYVLSPSIFEALDATPPGVGGEIQLTDAIRRLIRQGGRAYGIVLGQDERRFDIGNFDAYFRAFVEFALADPKHGPSLRAFVERLVR